MASVPRQPLSRSSGRAAPRRPSRGRATRGRRRYPRRAIRARPRTTRGWSLLRRADSPPASGRARRARRRPRMGPNARGSVKPPAPARRKQIVPKNVKERRQSVAPRDLLSFRVRPAAVRNRQLPDARPRLRESGRQLDFDPEAPRPERQPPPEVGPDQLVARPPLPEGQVGEHGGAEGEQVAGGRV